jgi:hypothetical protein
VLTVLHHFFEFVGFALDVNSLLHGKSPNIFVTVTVIRLLWSLAWNLLSVLRFLLRVGFYGAILMSIGAVLYLFGEISP